MLSQQDTEILDNLFVQDVQSQDTPSKTYEQELLAIKSINEGNVDQGLDQLTKIVEQSQEPSAFLNRAQTCIIMNRRNEAIKDLDKVIAIADQVHHKNILGKGYCLRAMLKHVQSGKAQVEETSINDFKMAASLGNNFAHQELTRLNPYAAMCNAILPELHKLS